MEDSSIYVNRVEFEELEELNQLVESMYIPEQELLNEFPKEVLMFIHFRTVGKVKMGEKVDSCTFTAFKEILKKNKKISNTERETIIKELLEYLSSMRYVDQFRNLDIKKVFDENSYTIYPYYKCLRELFDELWVNIYRVANIKSNDELQQNLLYSVKNYLIPDAHAYNLVVLFTLYKNVLPILMSEDFKGKDLLIIRFILAKFFVAKDAIHQKHITVLFQMGVSLNEATKEAQRKNQELIDCRNTLKEINKNKRSLEKRVETDNQKIHEYFSDLNSFKDTLQEEKININEVITEIRSVKTDVVKNTYDNIIEQLNERVSDLKSALKDKSRDYNSLSKDYKNLVSKSTYSILREYIEANGFTETLKNLISPYMPCDKCRPVTKVSNKEEKEVVFKEDIAGYCVLINNKHFVRFPNGDTIELISLPEGTYLTEGQVVLVSYKGEFKFAFQYTCLGVGLHPLVELTTVTVVEENRYQIGFNGKFKDLKNVPKDIRLRTMQVIVVDKEGNYIRSLRRMSLNADSLVPSMKIKEHIPYFVVNKVSKNKFLLRDIESDLEIEKEITCGNTDIKLYSVIGVNGTNELVSYFPTGKFYTLSSYYKRTKYGIVEFRDKVACANIIEDKELIKISDIPQNVNLEDGQVVKLDEFGGLLEVVNNDNNYNNKREVRIAKRTDRGTKEKCDNQEIKKEVLILGNLSYSGSYRLSFLKRGYNADVIDGYEPWNRVLREIKNKDLVILTTDFVSHENMFEIKKTNQATIFSDFDGANRLVEQVETYFANCN
jgi:Uncharacterized protein conserved in bacteria (DUF2325).